jgi:HSP20 family protein
MSSDKPDIVKKKDREEGEGQPLSRRADTFFENIRRNVEEMERAFARSWPPSLFELKFPQILPLMPLAEIRTPLCDLTDRGDRYELNLEVPGIEKEKIEVKATKHSIQVAGEHAERREEKDKDYIYNERSFKSFYRNIPLPEEILPSKIEAKVTNGILNVSMPKKVPTTKAGEEETKVEVK